MFATQRHRGHAFLLRDVLLVVLSWNCCWTQTHGWYITAPASTSDWKQLTRLLVAETTSGGTTPGQADDDVFAKLQWDLWGRRQATAALYRRQVATARQLRQHKYTVLVAKEWNEVLGVAEMGIRSDKERMAILGVLCVAEKARRQGVGAALVGACEETARKVWKEEKLLVEIEAINEEALRFFCTCGYELTTEESMVAVRLQQRTEQRPHLVLSKALHLCETEG